MILFPGCVRDTRLHIFSHFAMEKYDKIERERRSMLQNVSNMTFLPGLANDRLRRKFESIVNKEFDNKLKPLQEKLVMAHLATGMDKQYEAGKEQENDSSSDDSDMFTTKSTYCTSSKRRRIQEEVGEFEDSNTDSEIYQNNPNESIQGCHSYLDIQNRHAIVIDESRDDITANGNPEEHSNSMKVCDEDDFDLKNYNADSEIKKIQTSKLTMAIQGFRCNGSHQDDTGKRTSKEGTQSESQVFSEMETSQFQGSIYQKGHCYQYKSNGKSVILLVGIVRFLSHDVARCVLIVSFEDTILGIEDENTEYIADCTPSAYVQVHNEVSDIHLGNLGAESMMIQKIPSLVYEPQTPGCWQRFGYFLDNQTIQRRRKRDEIRILELFAGAGGMHQGFKNAGFVTVEAVENNKSAIRTLTKNNSVPVFAGDIKDFLQHHADQKARDLLGRIDHLHASPPCQGFSGANRLGGSADAANNELSKCFVDGVRLFQPTAATFENVLGMWRKKHIHYLKNIVKDLLQLEYQVRCVHLRACDYGDPQKRPRLFLFATKNSAPAPIIRTNTHGNNPDLLPFVTVRDAICEISNDKLHNMSGASTSLKPGQHGLIRLDAGGLAPSIRAGSLPPFHYEQDRCILVREAASLQSFPSNYVFYGNLQEQYRQIGNAVPVEMATAVAQSIRRVLTYRYNN